MPSTFAWTLVALSAWLVDCSRPSERSSSSTTGGDAVASSSAASTRPTASGAAIASASAALVAPLLTPSDPTTPLSVPPHWVVESDDLDRLLRDGAPDLLAEGWAANGKTCEHHFQARRRTPKPAAHVEAFVAFASEIGVSPSTDARGTVRLYADAPTKGPPFFALAEALDVIGDSNVFLHVKHPNVDVRACLERYAAQLPLGDLAALLQLPGVALDVVSSIREEGKKPSTMIRGLVARRADGAVIDWLLRNDFVPGRGGGSRSFSRGSAEIDLTDGAWTLTIDRSPGDARRSR